MFCLEFPKIKVCYQFFRPFSGGAGDRSEAAFKFKKKAPLIRSDSATLFGRHGHMWHIFALFRQNANGAQHLPIGKRIGVEDYNK